MDNKKIFELILRGYTKNQIVSVIPGLTINKLTYIMRKNNWKVCKKTKAQAIYSGRNQYIQNNIIIRNDKNYKDCPFIGISIHHYNQFTKNTVYVTAITYNSKRYKKASNKLEKVITYRDNFYKQYMPKKLKMIKRKEFTWFLLHPFNKFVFSYIKYKLNLTKIFSHVILRVEKNKEDKRNGCL